MAANHGPTDGTCQELSTFLSPFGEWFRRSESREKLRVYFAGALSDMSRKIVEPIALATQFDEPSLNMSLSTRDWDEDRIQDMTPRNVASGHFDPQGIGIADKTAHPTKRDKDGGRATEFPRQEGQDRPV